MGPAPVGAASGPNCALVHRGGLSYHARVKYRVLARSYRPQKFAELLGQEAVVRTLQNALETGTLGHAYLFSGLRGVGKTTAARLLAKAVNCEKGPAPEPCGECVSCQEITEGSSLDVVEIDAATHTGVDNVRELQEMLRYRPTRDRYRVIIVDEVHMLSKGAFNALLKSLEEPPPYILWILATTERHKVPATVLSRCQQLEFRPLAVGRIAAHLAHIATEEGFELSAGAAEAVARAAEGSVRDGLSLLDQLRAFSGDHIDEEAVAEVLGVPRTERIVGLVGHLVRGDAAAGLAIVREELAAGHDPVVLYEEVGRTLRRMAHLAVDPGLETGPQGELRRLLDEAAAGLGVAELTRMLGLWLEQQGLIRDGINRELGLEVACLRLSRWPSIRAVEALLTGQEPPAAAGPPPERGAGSGTGGGARRTGPAEESLSPLPEPVDARPAPPRIDAVDPSPHAPGSPGQVLAEALWPTRPRVAAAIDAARVELDGGRLCLHFPAAAAGLAAFLREEATTALVAEAAQAHLPGCETLTVSVEGEVAGREGGNGALRELAEADEGVALVQRILGGTIQSVVPDRGEEG